MGSVPYLSKLGGNPHQPHPGTRIHCCGCSLPGLTGFTAKRCEGTDADAIEGVNYAGSWGEMLTMKLEAE